MASSNLQNHPFTTVNPEAGGIPLILLPAREGDRDEILHRVQYKYFPKSIKIILINSYLKTPDGKHIESFEELAIYHANLLIDDKSLKLSKCYVGGFDFGAIAAYELMIQLCNNKIDVIDTFLLNPPFVTLLSDYHKSVNNWYNSYFPSPTNNKVTLFKCTIPDNRDILFQKMIDTPYLGIDKIASNLETVNIECEHRALLDPDNIKIILDKIKNKMSTQ